MKPRYRQQPDGSFSLVMPRNLRGFARSWDAAANSRLTSSWTRDSYTVDSELHRQLHTLQARALDAYKNNDHVKRFVGLLKTNVIGPKGIRLQVKSITQRGELDRRINNIVEAQWRRWGQVGSCEMSRKLSWLDVQRQIMTSIAVYGEALLYEQFPGNEFGYALQVIDPRRLDPRTTDDDQGVVMGVEQDAAGAPIAYWLSKHPDVSFGSFGASVSRTRRLNRKDFDILPADRVLHLHMPEFIAQTRGVPMVAASLYRLQHLKGYEEAEVIAARVAAQKLGFFEYTDVMGGEYRGDDLDADGNQMMTQEPGEWQQLPPGVRANMVDPSHPTDAFPDFVKAMLRGVASGLGVSYNSLASDLEGVNFSSLRQGALEERETYMALQEFMVEHACSRVYDRWLRSSLERGVIPNSRPDIEPQIAKLSSVEWQPRRWAWVDPLKNAQADQAYLTMGAKSLSEIIREDGRDPAEVFQEIANENEQLSALGVKVGVSEPVTEEVNDE